MIDSTTETGRDAEVHQLTEEVLRLRAELGTSRAVSAQALARATRLAQLVSALGQRTDIAEIFERAACEVAEQFASDIAVILTPPADGSAGLIVASQWGIAARHVPTGACPQPIDTQQLTALFPVVAGPVADLSPPEWLRTSRARHVVWGLLTARNEHLGYLLLVRRGDSPFESTDVQELAAVVSRIAMAVDNGRLYARTQEQLHRLQRLHEMTATLAGVVDVDQAAQDFADMLVADVPVAGAAIYLTTDQGHTFASQSGTFDDGRPPLTTEQRSEQPDVTRYTLGVNGTSLGTLLVAGAPAADSEARSFLEHLIDVGSLVLEKAKLFTRIRAQAETDGLTGLPNRTLFMDRLASALTHCRHAGTDLAVIFVDMDGFKAVNDVHGHDAGDQLLVEAAQRLSGAAGPHGLAARLGGDEFVVLLENATSQRAMLTVTNEIQLAMDAPYMLRGESGMVEATAGGSIGIGTAKASGYDALALLRIADTAMYAAKQARRSGSRTS